jgi:hypothetical protein
MEAASPPLTFPVSAVQATGPPLRPQGSLPRSLRDGSCGPPLTPEPLRPLTAQWQGAGTKPLPAGPHGAHDQAQQNKVSTVSGDCHYLNGYVPTLQTGGAVVSFLTAHLDYEILVRIGTRSPARWAQRGQAVPQPGLGSRI